MSIEKDWISQDSWRVYKDDLGSRYALKDYTPRILDHEGTKVSVDFQLSSPKEGQFPWACLALELQDWEFREVESITLEYRISSDSPFYFRLIEEDKPEYDQGLVFELPASSEWKTFHMTPRDFHRPGGGEEDLNPRHLDSLSWGPLNILGGASQSLEIRQCRLHGSFKEREWESQPPEERDLLQDPVCIYPFTLLRVDHQGIAPCCWVDWRTQTLGTGQGAFRKEWFGSAFEETRRGVRQGDYPRCSVDNCSVLPIASQFFRTREQLKDEYPEILEYLKDDNARWTQEPRRIDIAFDARCNLRCPSCSVDTLEKYPREVMENFLRDIESLGGNVRHIYMAAMGDPFATASYRQWLLDFPRKSFPKLEKISLQTNALQWSPELWNAMAPGLEGLQLEAFISVDGASPETYQFNRRGGSWERLKNNLNWIGSLRQEGSLDYLAIDCVVQKNNFREIPSIISYAEQWNADEVSFTKISNWGTYSDEEFKQIDVSDPEHGEHGDLLKIIQEYHPHGKVRGPQVFFRC